MEGIKNFKDKNYSESLSFFKIASNLYQNKLEPYFYMALATLKCSKSHQDFESMSKILTYLDKGFTCNPTNSPLLYMRALVKFSLKNLSEALIEIDQAIEKSEDNIPKYYYLRGLIYANAKHYKNALEDFSIVVQLDSKYFKAFLNRAKCYFLLGFKDKAFYDLKKFSEIRMKSSELHLWAGHFLINDGAYALATQAYTNSMNIKYKEIILIHRAKSNIMARELNAALEDLEKITEISKYSKAKYDMTALVALKTSSVQKDNDLFEQSGFLKSLESFTSLIDSKKQGLIFKLNDLYFYKGLMHFYLGQFDYAMEDFHKAFEIKKVFCEYCEESSSGRDSFNELLEVFENEDSQNPRFVEKEKNEEMTTFTNNSFNIYEYYHNCMIASIRLKQWRTAQDYGRKLMEIIPKDFKSNLSMLMKCVNLEKSLIENKITNEGGLIILMFLLSYNIIIIKVSDELRSLNQILVFPDNDRLSKIFPSFSLDFSFNPNLVNEF